MLEYEVEIIVAFVGEETGLFELLLKLGIYKIIVPNTVPSIKATPKSAIIFLFI
ncbi:MAG: hypothetical protein ACYDAP_00415 [Thermoplasmataceae archaeon]